MNSYFHQISDNYVTLLLNELMPSQRRLKTKVLKPIYKETDERRKGNLSLERERERVQSLKNKMENS